MTSSSKPRWWRASRDLAQRNARESQGRAARALVELDAALGTARAQVHTYAELDPGREADRLQSAWAPVDAQADEAMNQYLEAVSAKDLDTDVEEWVAQHAIGLFHDIAEKLTLATRVIEHFLRDENAAMMRIASLQSVLPRAIQDARRELADAQQAIEAVRSQGFLASEPAADLANARTTLDRIESGALSTASGQPPSGQQRLDAVRSVGADAAAIAARATSLAKERDSLAARIVSIRTAAQVARTQAADLPEILSELRRDYVGTSFAAVESSPAQVQAALARVDEALASANRMIADDQQRYGEAAQMLGTARAALDEAKAATFAVADRLNALHGARADPSVVWGEVRRSLRDAQRFVTAQPHPDPQAVAKLDGFAVRLDAARQVLARSPRPDYGAYLDELQAVRIGSAQIVAGLRAHRASR